MIAHTEGDCGSWSRRLEAREAEDHAELRRDRLPQSPLVKDANEIGYDLARLRVELEV